MTADEPYDEASAKLRVAILYTSQRRLSDLVKVLESNGLSISKRIRIGDGGFGHDNLDGDVILVDLDESAEQVLGLLETLLETATLPILFNDSATTEFVVNTANPEWGQRLVSKLWSLTKRRRPLPAPALKLKPSAKFDPPKKPPAPRAQSAPLPPIKPSQKAEIRANGALKNVWVLGASLGGPLAVREFLSLLPNDLPVAFVLAQHIGASHVDLLAEQLDRITPFRVMVGQTGHVLKHHEVALAPVNERIVIDALNRIVLKQKKEETIYTPSIDFVMEDMAERFGADCGTIVFSGMGNDGERGCRAIADAGGLVWAQDAETCVISSMPDNARKTGNVTFSGTPEALARQLIKHFSGASPDAPRTKHGNRPRGNEHGP